MALNLFILASAALVFFVLIIRVTFLKIKKQSLTTANPIWSLFGSLSFFSVFSIFVLINALLLTTSTPLTTQWTCSQKSIQQCIDDQGHSFEVRGDFRLPKSFSMTVYTNRWSYGAVARQDLQPPSGQAT
jgi:hypothetical protein